MSFCFDKGIQHRKWLSWPAEERAKMMAFMMEKAEQCALCGTSQWEWDENKFSYEPTERFCRGCYLKETSAEDRNRLPGTTIEMTPVTEMFRAKQIVHARHLAEMDTDG
jgi:hypothetical protein